MPRFRAPGKPQYGARVDPAHPLARGLVRAWLFGAGAGTPDLVAGRGIDTTPAGTVWSPAEGGALENSTLAGAVGTDLLASNTASGTVAWRLYAAFSPTGGSIRQMWGHAASGGVPEFSAQIYSDNNWYVGWSTSGADRRVTFAATSASLVQNAWQTYVLTWGPAGSVLYRNGVVVGSNGTAPTVASVPVVFAINNRNDNGSYASNGLPVGSRTAWMLLYDRALTAGEVWTLTAAPFAFLQPRPRVVKSPAGGGTYTATATLTLPAMTASGSGTFTAPTYTATAAPTLPVVTASGTGTFAAPVYTATATPSLPHLTAAGSGAFTAPVYTGSAPVTLPPLTATGTGALTAPVYTGSAAITPPPLAATGDGIFASAVYSGNAAVSLPTIMAGGSGTFTVPTYTGSAAPNLPALTGAGSGTFTAAGAGDPIAGTLVTLTLAGTYTAGLVAVAAPLADLALAGAHTADLAPTGPPTATLTSG